MDIRSTLLSRYSEPDEQTLVDDGSEASLLRLECLHLAIQVAGPSASDVPYLLKVADTFYQFLCPPLPHLDSDAT